MPSSDQDGLRRLERKVFHLARYFQYYLKADRKYPSGNSQDRLAVVMGWFNNCWERVERFGEKCKNYPAERRYTIGLRLMSIRAVLGPLWARIERYVLDLQRAKISEHVDRRIIHRPEEAGAFSLLMAAPMGEGMRLC